MQSLRTHGKIDSKDSKKDCLINGKKSRTITSLEALASHRTLDAAAIVAYLGHK